MKKIFTLALIAAGASAFAQPKLISQATVITKTTIVAAEGDDQQSGNFTSENGEQVRVMRFGGDGESKTTTTIKNDLVKTFSESEMGRTTVIRDNNKKITTTMMEMMGRKNAFYATDEDQAEMAKRMDSMMKSRGQNARMGSATLPVFTIEYKEDTKKIAGFTCKKALVIGTRSNGKSDTTEVWYCPDFKLQNVASTGGSAGGFAGMTSIIPANGMEGLNGFPMKYERTMNRGRKMTVEVTKVVIDKDIADKEFEIPKDVEIKPMKDMQNGGGPGFQMRIGG